MPPHPDIFFRLVLGIKLLSAWQSRHFTDLAISLALSIFLSVAEKSCLVTKGQTAMVRKYGQLCQIHIENLYPSVSHFTWTATSWSLLVLLDMTGCRGTCLLLCFSDAFPADLCSLPAPLLTVFLPAGAPVGSSYHTAAKHLQGFGTKPFPFSFPGADVLCQN